MNDTCHIALCPNCSRSISRTISRAPSQIDLVTLRNGDLPPENIPSRDYISKAEEAEREILAFDAEIRRLQALTQDLQAHRQSLADYAAQQRSLVAPVRHIPTEVLEAIFLLACRTPEFAFPLQESMTTARTLSHVCHTWRKLLATSKQLWLIPCIKVNITAIDSPKFREEQVNEYRRALIFYLARSDPLPFSVDLRGDGCVNIAHRSGLHPVLPEGQFIAYFIRRCQHADFDCTYPLHLDEIFSAFARSVRKHGGRRVLIERLDSIVCHESSDLEHLQLYANFLRESAPHLKRWSQTFTELGGSEHLRFHAPMSQLTHLDVMWMSAISAYDALADCTVAARSIARFLFGKDRRATRGRHDGTYTPPPKPVVLPSLVSLRLVARPARTILGDFLASLTAPPLMHARLRHGSNKYLTDYTAVLCCEGAPEDRPDFPHAEFAQFLAQSDCKMNSLEIEGVCTGAGDVALLRARLPDVTNLVRAGKGRYLDRSLPPTIKMKPEDVISISLCPSCPRSITCTGSPFSPSQDAVVAIRGNDASLETIADNDRLNKAMSAEQQAHILTLEIDRLLAMAGEVQAHRQRLLDFAAEQRAIAAPIRKVPDEVLEQIFRFACADVVFTYPLSKSMLATATISHVCHRWRTIAENDKQLWTPVCVKLDTYEIEEREVKPTPERLLPFQNALIAYLEKSDPRPFAVDLHGPCVAFAYGPKRTLPLLPASEFFEHFARRCHHARLCTTSFAYLDYLYGIEFRARMPEHIEIERLASFELVEDRTHREPDRIMPYHAVLFTERAPRLRSWTQNIVDSTSPSFDGVILHAPRNNLVRLEVSWMEWPLAGWALAPCVNLKELIIGVFAPPNTWNNAEPNPLTLPNLESLTVATVPVWATLSRLLSILTAPRLRHARLRCAKPDENQTVKSAPNNASESSGVASSAAVRRRNSKPVARKRTRGDVDGPVQQKESSAAEIVLKPRTSTHRKSKRARNDTQDDALPSLRRSARILARSHCPIHWLPSELLSEIFLHFLELINGGFFFVNPIPRLDTTITRVCRKWRNVAYGTPRLWRHLVPPKGGCDQYLRRYIPLTGQCPLDVSGFEAQLGADRLLRKLRPHSHRLRALILSGACDQFRMPTPIAALNLEDAYLLMFAEGPLDTITPLAFLEDASRLSSLHMHLERVYTQVISLPPMKCLTELTLFFSRCVILSVRGPLEQCSQTLRKLKITIALCEARPAPADALALPALRSLDLEYNAAGVLELISAPNLEKLKIDGPAPDSPALLLAYLARVPSTATNLRWLDFATMHTEEWDKDTVPAILIECFAKLKALETIRFNSFPEAFQIFGCLTVDLERSAPLLLPNLRVGVFGRDHYHWPRPVIPSEAYRAFVESRARAQSVGGIVVKAAQISQEYCIIRF
ncbi:uncharacterized protein SCHCODRAFT_02686258 [Schizophyllum commune H4-8]|nr:uncharacterized protein SCHCODRAFT_02686258 [Schizophyllum commune H4-8]KAI5894692.1 hypothetical protein SCHCODRAFT_02686258 [Schizophyllum commune H4-8]